MIAVFSVSFRISMGVFWARIVLRALIAFRAFPLFWSVKPVLDALGYSNTLCSGLWNRNVGGLELLLKLPCKLRVEGHC